MFRFYYHESSANHGCEAIVRSTDKLLPGAKSLHSRFSEDDRAYFIHDLMPVYQDSSEPLRGWHRLLASFDYRVLGQTVFQTKYAHEGFFNCVQEGDVCLSIGGDNYCYPGAEILGDYNRILKHKGAKTVLWGCSIEPKMATKAIREDFARYDLIVAREQISYKFLKQCNPNTIATCDPAFFLPCQPTVLPAGFEPGNTVGVNISPLILQRESTMGIVQQNYERLIDYILDSTDYQVALIPHVVQAGGSDLTPLRTLYEYAKDKNRICLVEDHNCMELKHIISNCVLFLGARTHATIAAYSTYVPTLVLGYSTKALGIAADLFSTTEGYVLPASQIKDKDDLLLRFCWLDQNKVWIKEQLKARLPEYVSSMDAAISRVMDLS